MIFFFNFQIWSAKDFKPIKTLLAHEEKITSLDITGGNANQNLICW